MNAGLKFFVVLLLVVSGGSVVLEVPYALEMSYWLFVVLTLIWVLFSSSPTVRKEKGKRGVRMLMIDDDQVNAMITKKYFLKQHPEFKIEHSSSATEGLVYLKRNQVDVILLDLLMPDIQGDYVIRKLKQESPELLKKIIVFTSLSEHADEMKDVIANRVKYVTKPTDDESISHLVRSVEELLKLNQTG